MSTAAEEVVDIATHPNHIHESAETRSLKNLDVTAKTVTEHSAVARSSESSGRHDVETEKADATAQLQTGKAMEVHSIPKNNLPLVFSGLMLTVFLAALDQTIVAVALPTIVRDLDGDTNLYSWVGAAYLLTSSAFIPLW